MLDFLHLPLLVFSLTPLLCRVNVECSAPLSCPRLIFETVDDQVARLSGFAFSLKAEQGYYYVCMLVVVVEQCWL